MNTRWRFHKVTNLTVFAALLKEVPMGYMNAVLPELLLKNHTINCLTYEEKTRQPNNDNFFLFRALALHLHGTQPLDEEASKLFNLFIKKVDGLSPNHIQRLHMSDIPTAADLLTLNIPLYDIDIVDGNIFGELARPNLQKYETNVRVLRYNNHICYVNNINAVFQLFRCFKCDTFFNKTFNFERHLTTCSERVKNVYTVERISIPRKFLWKAELFWYQVYEWKKILQKFCNTRLWIDSCPRGDLQRHNCNKLDKETCTNICIFFFKLEEEPIVLRKSDPRHLVESSIGAPENLASQSKAKMENFFLDIKTAMKNKVGRILDKLSQRHNRREHARFDMSQDDCDNEICASTQFLQIQKKIN